MGDRNMGDRDGGDDRGPGLDTTLQDSDIESNWDQVTCCVVLCCALHHHGDLFRLLN